MRRATMAADTRWFAGSDAKVTQLGH